VGELQSIKIHGDGKDAHPIQFMKKDTHDSIHRCKIRTSQTHYTHAVYFNNRSQRYSLFRDDGIYWTHAFDSEGSNADYPKGQC
jgi:hypothetical protein